ncbi:MAG: SRPBCC family protein [Bacteroidota bacterium]
MPTIKLKTEIEAPIQRVFDLARSIDLHKISTASTREEAIAGVTSGLISGGGTVTWRAKHFGVFQELTSKITEFDPPRLFVDEMQKGIFKSLKHEHLFEVADGHTIMTDTLVYVSPLGPLGQLADWLFLEKYLMQFLKDRNEVVKEYAEGDGWQEVLKSHL